MAPMPNHVINEIIFRNVDAEKQMAILAACCGDDGKVDFNILVPKPLNIWQFSVGTKHEAAFQQTGLDWARLNWGTKWNAYDHRPIQQTDDTLTIAFETAWRPPYGWLVAVFNKFQIAFDHNWMNEGDNCAVCGKFVWVTDDMRADPWIERPADEAEQRRIHKLMWGVEQFEDDGED